MSEKYAPLVNEDQLPAGRHLLQLMDNLEELVVVLRLDGTCAWCNQAFANLLGHSREALVGKAYPLPELRELMVAKPREQVESWVTLEDGSARLIRFTADTGLDVEDCVESLLIVGRDMTAFYRLQHPLQGVTDTGLLSATDAKIQARIEHALHRAQRAQEYVGFMAIQVSGGQIRDELQQTAVLNRLVENLRQHIRMGDTLARLDSGAYLLVLEQIDCPEAITAVVDKIAAALDESAPADMGGFAINAGVATSPDDGFAAPELIDRAQQAMQRAIADDLRVRYF